MSEYLVVDVELLERVMNIAGGIKTETLGQLHCDGVDPDYCFRNTTTCAQCLIENSNGVVKPLPASAQFAGEMEEFIRTHFAEHEEVGDPWYSCPKIDDYAGPFKNGICLCGKDEADALLAKIKAAGEET